MARYTDSEINWNLATKWLSTCDQSHSCRLPSTGLPQYPTRLLDVSTEILRLIITKESRPTGNYATLSHCWGDAQFLQLSAKTMGMLQIGFRCEQLPKTFQHAIQATRSLKLRYLWIDSLCIIQGSDVEARADWQFEAARMEEVYRNSYCNSMYTARLLLLTYLFFIGITSGCQNWWDDVNTVNPKYTKFRALCSEFEPLG